MGTVLCGKVVRGTFKEGDEILLIPGGIHVQCKTIEKNYTRRLEAKPGDLIGMNLKNVSVRDIAKFRGFVIGCDAAGREALQKRDEREMFNDHNVVFFNHR